MNLNSTIIRYLRGIQGSLDVWHLDLNSTIIRYLLF